MMDRPVILEARNLSVSLGGRRVLSAVSAGFQAGEITAVIGPNGAGKSTLLKALAGLAMPDAGSVHLDSTPLGSVAPDAIGREIAYLPQDRIVHWPLRVRAVVALGRLPYQPRGAGESGTDRQAISDAIAATDVAHVADRSIAALSGGERARVLMARALAQEARILIADEPTAGLDPAHALQLFDVLKGLATRGRAVIAALHDLSLAARFADRIVLLKDGAIVADGEPETVLSPEMLKHAYAISARLIRVDGIPVVLPVAPATSN